MEQTKLHQFTSNLPIEEQLDLIVEKFPHFDIIVGTDIEIFLEHKGKIISSFGFERYADETGIVERDGFPLELQPSPNTVPEKIYKNITNLMSKIKTPISKDSTVIVDIEKLKRLGDEESLKFGCKPDLNLYLKDFNIKDDATKIALRSCGGHLHATIEGYTPNILLETESWKLYTHPEEPYKTICESTIKWADILLGTLSVVLDKDTIRRKLYGNAGDFRYTSYGIEYRTLSNYWLFKKSYYTTNMLLWQACVYLSQKNITPPNIKNIQQIINLYKKNKAKKIFIENINKIITFFENNKEKKYN